MYAAVKGLAPKTQAIQHVANGLTCCTKSNGDECTFRWPVRQIIPSGHFKRFLPKGQNHK